MSKHPDAVIIGGGIIGLTSAYFLAQSGLSVEVLDRTDLGREASWAGAGILPPGNCDCAATPIDQLRALGSAQFPHLSVELRELNGIDNGYRRCGGIEFLQRDDEYVLPLWESEGITFERLSRNDLRTLEPGLGEVEATPYLLPDCAQVRNPWHLRALIAGCERLGVRLRPHSDVVSLDTRGGRIERVVLGSESVSGNRYLIAAGAWSEPFLRQLGHQPHVHPVRGQIVLLRTPRPSVSRVLMLGKEYLVPRGDGRVLVGSTEEPEVGFVKGNTEDAVKRLRELAVRTVPALANAEIEKCWSGLRPGSADGLPFLGAVPGCENAVVATGHFRAGVQLSIGTAQVVAELFAGNSPRVSLEPFRLDRVPDVGTKPTFRS